MNRARKQAARRSVGLFKGAHNETWRPGGPLAYARDSWIVETKNCFTKQ